MSGILVCAPFVNFLGAVFVCTYSTSGALSLLIGGMTKAAAGPGWPMLAPALFAGTLVLYVLALPLGLVRVEAAPLVAAGLALDTGSERFPFAVLLLRVVDFLPLGDVAFRANLASAIACSLAVALAGRMAVELLALLRPPAHARQDSRDFVHEPIAAGGAAMAAALTYATFDIGTGATGAAVTLALLLCGLRAARSLLADRGAAASGYALAALAGLAVGLDGIAGPLLWPPLVGLMIWTLRTGPRWPLMAPLCFVAGWATVGLATLAASTVPLSFASLLPNVGALAAPTRDSVLSTALELADQVGVIGILLAAIGVAMLAARALVLTAWLALTGLTAILFAQLGNASTRAALPVAAIVCFVFASVGLVHVAGRLGRARLAASLALAVILVFSPALDRGPGRWSRRPSMAMRLLDRALERAEPGSVVDPGTPEIAGLFRLAAAIGLRPDLAFEKPKRSDSKVGLR